MHFLTLSFHNKIKEKLGTLPPEVPYYSAEEVPDRWRKLLSVLVQNSGLITPILFSS
jgi:hypothetical protein